MTSSIRSPHPHGASVWSLARARNRNDQSPRRRRHDARRLGSSLGRRRALTAATVLVVAVLAVVLLDLAGFDHRLAAGAIAVLTCDVFASWVLIARANRGSSRRPRRARS